MRWVVVAWVCGAIGGGCWGAEDGLWVVASAVHAGRVELVAGASGAQGASSEEAVHGVSVRVAEAEGQALRAGGLIWGRVEDYEGQPWLTHWWPVSPSAVAWLGAADGPQRAGGTGTSIARRSDRGPAPGRVLGLLESGDLLRWGDDRLEKGFLLVPVWGPQQTTAAAPIPVAAAGRLREHLALTEHRDLPLLFWSMDPSADSVARCRQWLEAAFPNATAQGTVAWVHAIDAEVSTWREVLGLPWARVHGQDPVAIPTLVAVGRDGAIAFHYEGWEWPAERIERALDAALLRRPE